MQEYRYQKWLGPLPPKSKRVAPRELLLTFGSSAGALGTLTLDFLIVYKFADLFHAANAKERGIIPRLPYSQRMERINPSQGGYVD